MKRLLSLLLLVLTALSLLSGCGGQATIASQTPQTQPEPTQTSTPEPEKYVPMDIFGSDFNPFSSAQFPENFNLYAMLYSVGNKDIFEGGPNCVLCMTAEGKPEEAITFLAKLTGIEYQSAVNKLISDFNSNGSCSILFDGDGHCDIYKTAPNDGISAPNVEGCYIKLLVSVDSAKEASYLKLFRDNYNVSALTAVADYFDVTPAFDKIDIKVNLNKKYAEFGLNYSLADVETIQQKMVDAAISNWYDSEMNRMGLSYGAVDLSLDFDSKDDNIFVTERTSDLRSALSSYAAPEVSLSTLGFNYSEKDALCIFEDKQNKLSFAVHNPEWGPSAETWNIVFLDEINGYLLAVWYYAPERKLVIQVGKGSSEAKYDYFIDTGKYANEYPAPDTVKAQFETVFDTKDDDVYGKAIALFEQTLQEYFGIDMDALYALPIR